jgi:hypothetical protein
MYVKSGNQSEAQSAPASNPAMVDIRHISEEQLAALGVSHVAYLKPVTVQGVQGVAIHAADGTPMAVAGSREIAQAVVVQHEMVPLSVH